MPLRSILHWTTYDLTDVALLRRLDAALVHTFPVHQPLDGRPGLDEEHAYVPYFSPPSAYRELLRSKWRGEVEALHEAGILVIASHPSTGFRPDLYERAGIRAQELQAVDLAGREQPMLGGAYSAFGDVRSSCYSNPRWMGLLAEMALLYADAGFDGIWLDVFGLVDDAVLYCHCVHCRSRWHEHLGAMGMAHDTPLGTRESLRDDLDGHRRHVEWRLDVLARGLRGIRESVRARHPAFLLSLNTSIQPGMEVSGMCMRLLQEPELLDFVHIEEFGHPAGPYSLICSYLLARALAPDRPVYCVFSPPRGRYTRVQHELVMAEAIACGVSQQHWSDHPDETGRSFRYLHDHEAVLRAARPMGEVGVLFSPRSKILYEDRCEPPLSPAYAMGTLLLGLHIPFRFLCADRLAGALDGIECLIVPDLACLSDAELRALEAHADAGGIVIATGKTGELDGDGRPRLSPGIVASAGGEGGTGTVVRMPFSPEEAFWRLHTGPLRSPDLDGLARFLADALLLALGAGRIREACSARTPLEISAAPTTVVLPAETPDGILVHLLNYDLCADRSEVRPASVRLRVPLPRASGFSLACSTVAGPHPLTRVEVGPSGVELAIDGLGAYAMLHLVLRDGPGDPPMQGVASPTGLPSEP